MNISDINPHIRYARVHKSYFYTRKDFSKCYDCRIFFFDQVQGTIIIGEEEFNITNKTAVYLPPESEYKFDITFEKNGRILVFDFDFVNTFRNTSINSLGTATIKTFKKELVLDYTPPIEFSLPIVKILPQIDRMLMKCTENFIIKSAFYLENSSALLKLCLLEFLRPTSGNNQRHSCEKILKYIHENFNNPSVTNEEIAEKFNYHPYHLSRLIKQETGKTLHNYLIYYRIQIAKDMLLTTKKSISEISWKCGFCTSAYFTKIFKGNTGMTPKEYRQLQIHTEL